MRIYITLITTLCPPSLPRSLHCAPSSWVLSSHFHGHSNSLSCFSLSLSLQHCRRPSLHPCYYPAQWRRSGAGAGERLLLTRKHPPRQNCRFSIVFNVCSETMFFSTAQLVLNSQLNFPPWALSIVWIPSLQKS